MQSLTDDQRVVLVRPGHPAGLQDRLFETGAAMGPFGNFNTPFSFWRRQCAEHGFVLHTWDMAPLSRADVFWIIDLPARRAEITRLRREYPNTPLVLQIHESPVDRLHYFDRRNHREFDRVMTYGPPSDAGEKYISYRLAASDIGERPPPRGFAERRPMAMIQTNRCAGWMASRGAGASGLPVIGPVFGGWRVPWLSLFAAGRGENYSRRRRLARTAETLCRETFDLFGPGWTGESVSWVHRLRRPKPFACVRSNRATAKYELLGGYRFVIAFENYSGNLGYISEKLFDAFYARCVPVYLGDAEIEKHVPPAAFVDARKFRSPEALLEYCRDCPQAEWEAMYHAGQAFRRSDAIRPFQEEDFSRRALAVLRTVSSPARGARRSHTSPKGPITGFSR